MDLNWEPEIEDTPALSGWTGQMPPATTSYGPVSSSPNVLCDVELVINRACSGVNDDGISFVVDKDAESDIYFTTVILDDVNGDGNVDDLDITPFVGLPLGGGQVAPNPPHYRCRRRAGRS